MKTVLFFDYWTEGVRTFAPLLAPLRERGFEARLLHLGSWRNPAVPREEVVKGLLCRDISAYSGSLTRALRSEKPDVVVGLNYTMLMDRTLRRLCHREGIKTVYMMHGIRCTGKFLDRYVEIDNRNWNWRRRAPKVLKYLRLVPLYLYSVARSRPSDFLRSTLWAYLWQLAVAPSSALNTPRPSWDLVWDRVLAYGEIDRDEFIGRFAFPSDKVVVIGNPSVDEASRLWSSRECPSLCREYLQSIGVPVDRNLVLYIEGALVEQGDLGFTHADRLRELEDVLMAAQRAAMHVVVKMHPAADSSSVLARFQDRPGITVLCNADLAKLVWSCDVALTTFSTVALMPIALGRPIIEPKWVGVLRKLPMMFDGVAFPAYNTSELQDYFTRIAAGERLMTDVQIQETRRRWVAHLDGGTVNRVVDAIAELVGECQQKQGAATLANRRPV